MHRGKKIRRFSGLRQNPIAPEKAPDCAVHHIARLTIGLTFHKSQ
jgi:hypothetical protein